MGQSNEIFDPHFFSSFEPAWATDQWVNTFSILVKILLCYSNFTESPPKMIIRRVILPLVSYCLESISPQYHTAQRQSTRSIILQRVMWRFRILFKGKNQQDFQFFSSFKPDWATDQWVKIFLILVSFQIFHINLPAVSYCIESVSPQYVMRWVNLPTVSYCTESVFPQYDNAMSQSPRSHTAQSHSWPREVNSHILIKTFAQAFKGTVSQK